MKSPFCAPLPDSWNKENLPIRDETVLAWLETDLDENMNFSKGLLVLTESRLFHLRHGGENRQWTVEAGHALEIADHAGVGRLSLRDAHSGLAFWRYTLGQDAAARRLMQCFSECVQAAREGRIPSPPRLENCPGCGVALLPGEARCSACTELENRPPSTITLFRLWRFARPYKSQLFAGFLLTLLSTGATLVPPYLTMPLMDKVLIP
ncbi:MAG: ABC transporter, partial [Burkholderiales bacterium]|nr:ABC transporter [Burkholderiales bacterium]